MMKTSAKVVTVDQSEEIEAILKDIAAVGVYVGIPEDESPREGSGQVSNAQLMYIHTNGSELRGIPARPIIEPAIEAEDNKEKIAEQFSLAAESALKSAKGVAMSHLEKAGMYGQNSARGWFTDPRNGWEPNSPTTILRKGSERPLIDTGQLRASITYVVKEDDE